VCRDLIGQESQLAGAKPKKTWAEYKAQAQAVSKKDTKLQDSGTDALRREIEQRK
jgi:hypothetical protein